MRRRPASSGVVGDDGPVLGLDVGQALGRLPWFAAFLRRARRLRPFLAISIPLVPVVRSGPGDALGR